MKIDVYIEPIAMKLNQTFTYNCIFDVKEGMRVRVPFGSKEYVGIVEKVNVDTDLEMIKDVLEVLDEKPLLNEEMKELAKYMSSFYVCSMMSCFRTMLPPALRPSSNHAHVVYEDYLVLSNSNEPLKPKQKQVYEEIKDSLPCKASLLRKTYKIHISNLIRLGYLRVEKREKSKDLVSEYMDEVHTLTLDQEIAIQSIRECKENTVLLHGVTGSGKTEVFLQLADAIVKQGKQVLFLVPEIGLTPMMIKRVAARFGNRIAIYHSQLNAQEKYDQYKLVLDGKVDIVVGTRSSIFMPFDNLGLILMDEEHDSSYKQDNMPRYHTRDIALWRANYHNCKVVLASATPSLESYARAYKARI
ncbi:MAG: DEAD/DEAH box helicase, partial [Holdemanella sp.]|nr:DEAD/DEAH box helicase [Holdemanella sp.]